MLISSELVFGALQTARTDLLDLAERGLLQKRKRGRTWHFLPAEDLEKRLAELE